MSIFHMLIVPFVQLDRPETVIFVLKYVTNMVDHDLEQHICITTIKKHLHGMRIDYEAFVAFITYPRGEIYRR